MSQKLSRRIYYQIKPYVPIRILLYARRKYIRRLRRINEDIWPIDEKCACPPEGWKGWPEGKKFALVLTHDVESEKGIDRCHKLMELEKEIGFRSSFYFLTEEYNVNADLRRTLTRNGFEVGLHGLRHNGDLYNSRKVFLDQAARINRYLKEWRVAGFRSPAMHHNLEWILDLNVEYDSSTFDTDPFEPQPDGVGTIFPFRLQDQSGQKGYVELPYTLPQDHTLFILMKERDIDIWKRKLDWIVECGGMALFITHPDYMHFGSSRLGFKEYPVRYYEDFLKYVQLNYEGQYWNVLPRDLTRFWNENYAMLAKPCPADTCEIKKRVE